MKFYVKIRQKNTLCGIIDQAPTNFFLHFQKHLYNFSSDASPEMIFHHWNHPFHLIFKFKKNKLISIPNIRINPSGLFWLLPTLTYNKPKKFVCGPEAKYSKLSLSTGPPPPKKKKGPWFALFLHSMNLKYTRNNCLMVPPRVHHQSNVKNLPLYPPQKKLLISL